MILRAFFAALLAAAIALPVHASITTRILAVETSSELLSVPTTPTGRVLLRSCDECELHSPRLTPETAFTVGNERMSFVDFRQAFYNLKRYDERYVLVSYHVESNTVTSVEVGE